MGRESWFSIIIHLTKELFERMAYKSGKPHQPQTISSPHQEGMSHDRFTGLVHTTFLNKCNDEKNKV